MRCVHVWLFDYYYHHSDHTMLTMTMMMSKVLTMIDDDGVAREVVFDDSLTRMRGVTMMMGQMLVLRRQWLSSFRRLCSRDGDE